MTRQRPSIHRHYVDTRVVYVLFARKISVLLTVDRQSQINLQIAARADRGASLSAMIASLSSWGDARLYWSTKTMWEVESGERRVVFERARVCRKIGKKTAAPDVPLRDRFRNSRYPPPVFFPPHILLSSYTAILLRSISDLRYEICMHLPV